MRIYLLALVAAILAACILTPSQEETAWTYACELSQYSCAGIEPPEVIYEELRPGLGGYYDGTDEIHVSENQVGRERIATLIHEMVHYLQVKVGGITVPNIAAVICPMEDEAWEVEGMYWVLVGMPENVREKWFVNYPHCWEFADDFVQFPSVGIRGRPKEPLKSPLRGIKGL